MIHRIKKTETRETTHVVSVQCDICKEVFEGADATVDWTPGEKINITTPIMLKQGEQLSFDIGGFAKETIYHVCPTCFITKLEPWLKSQGAEPTTSKYDW